MRKARRITLFTSFCVMLGVVTTVAVAWALAAYAPDPTYNTRHDGQLPLGVDGSDYLKCTFSLYAAFGTRDLLGDSRAERLEFVSERRPSDLPVCFRNLHVPPRELVIAYGEQERLFDDPARIRIMSRASGWPLLALRWQTRIVLERGRGGPRVLDGIELDSLTESKWSSGYPRALPLYVLWEAFALDTVLYAVVWYAFLSLFLHTMRILKHALRRRRNACTHCGYNLHGLPPSATICPECGKPTPATASPS